MPDETWTEKAWALGLMSGTSRDGVDAALIRSNGRRRVTTGASLSRPYEAAFRRRLAAACDGALDGLAELERDLTHHHAEAVRALLAGQGIAAEEVAVIGFHGHTIAHAPAAGITRQIGDGALLARATGIDVVADFRSADVAAGGEGAPLAPLYHLARSQALARPLAVLNLGGVANLTWIGAGIGAGADEEAALLAFDTGPGNAPLDDWMAERRGEPCDRDGRLAAQGRVREERIAAFLAAPYFARRPPKSLDRGDFDTGLAKGLSDADGAATLSAAIAAAVARAAELCPAPPRRWLVTGGGRRNPVIMAMLAARLGRPVAPVESVGWDGDALEAEAFAYLAVRSRKGLALSLPGTTGVKAPTSGGRLFRAPR